MSTYSLAVGFLVPRLIGGESVCPDLLHHSLSPERSPLSTDDIYRLILDSPVRTNSTPPNSWIPPLFRQEHQGASLFIGDNHETSCPAGEAECPDLVRCVSSGPERIASGPSQEILTIAETIRSAGGRALMVGGFVRDMLLGRESKDFDLEVHGLPLEQLERVLGRFGNVIKVGRSFEVLRIKGLEADFSVPLDPKLSFEEASRQRDLTINSIGWDPLSGEVLDPHGGRRDLERRILRATDPLTFSKDPLRGLRVARFVAQFDMEPDSELLELCSRLDLAELPGERLWGEFCKMLLKGRRPSGGLEFLRQTGLLRFFPELAVLVNIPQDPDFHPEGTVWQHTLLVVDEAAKARGGDDDQDLIILFAALCHDLGKATTTIVKNGRIRSPGHSEEGVIPTESLLKRLRASSAFIAKIKALVCHHLAPTLLVADGSKPKAYRRLARRLEKAGVTARHLFLLGRADHLGALAKEYPYGEPFLKAMSELGIDQATRRDVVLGRHLIEHGLTPGPHFTPLLEKCRDIQDETGWGDPKRILERALDTGDGGRPNLLPHPQQSDIDSAMINLPANPTDNDIKAIEFLLPGGFRLTLDQGKVVMTVLGGSDFGIPLFTFEIAPYSKKDYQGTLLSSLLEDLARRVSNALRNTPFDSPDNFFNDSQNVTLLPAQDVILRHYPKREFSIQIGKILSTEPSDWKVD